MLRAHQHGGLQTPRRAASRPAATPNGARSVSLAAPTATRQFAHPPSRRVRRGARIRKAWGPRTRKRGRRHCTRIASQPGCMHRGATPNTLALQRIAGTTSSARRNNRQPPPYQQRSITALLHERLRLGHRSRQPTLVNRHELPQRHIGAHRWQHPIACKLAVHVVTENRQLECAGACCAAACRRASPTLLRSDRSHVAS